MIENTFRAWKEEHDKEEKVREARAKVNYLLQVIGQLQEASNYPPRLRYGDALYLLKSYESQASELYKPYFQYYIRMLESVAFVSDVTTDTDSPTGFILSVSAATVDPEWTWVPRDGTLNQKTGLPPVDWYL